MEDKTESDILDTFFFHVRFDLPSQGKNKNFRDDLPNRCKSITGAVVFDKNMNYQTGLSYCSKKDQFNRKIGRNVAAGRAMKRLHESPILIEDSRIKSNPELYDRKLRLYFAKSIFFGWLNQ